MSSVPREGGGIKGFSQNDIKQKIMEGCQCCAAASVTCLETLILPWFSGGGSSICWKQLNFTPF